MEHLRSVPTHSQTATRGVAPSLIAGLEDLPDQLRNHLAALGPMPMTTLAVFVDLDVSDAEIARYFGLPVSVIRRLCAVWCLR